MRIVFIIIIAYGLGAIITAFQLQSKYQLEIQALHTQIEKQNCEENTIPRLKKELLGK